MAEEQYMADKMKQKKQGYHYSPPDHDDHFISQSFTYEST